MAQEEIRLLDTNECILLIRDERPILDKKYDLLQHPNIQGTADGGGTPYIHKRTREPYELGDLPFEFQSLKTIEFMEDIINEEDSDHPEQDP